MWEDDSSPRLTLETLHLPLEQGGLNLLDISARNEAIDIMWLKDYLNLATQCPTWAVITDLIIDTAAPENLNKKARGNTFLQTWNPPTRGRRASKLDSGTIRMIKVAGKYNTDLAALRLTPHLWEMLPAWYHLSANPHPITSVAAKCLLNIHISNQSGRPSTDISTHLYAGNTPITPTQPTVHMPELCQRQNQRLSKPTSMCRRSPRKAEPDNPETKPTKERWSRKPLPN